MKKQALSAQKPQKTVLISRIEQAIREKGISARQWSLGATGKPDTIRNILRGKTYSPRSDTLQALADYIGRSQDWLTGRSNEAGEADGFQPPASLPAGKVTLLGYIGAGDRVYHFGIGEAQLEPVPAPPDVKRGIAAIVRGASMLPVYRDGDMVIATEHLGSLDELAGQDCFVQVVDGPLYLKVLRRASKGMFHLRSYNPDTSEILAQKVEWAAPVAWIKRRR